MRENKINIQSLSTEISLGQQVASDLLVTPVPQILLLLYNTPTLDSVHYQKHVVIQHWNLSETTNTRFYLILLTYFYDYYYEKIMIKNFQTCSYQQKLQNVEINGALYPLSWVWKGRKYKWTFMFFYNKFSSPMIS